MIHIEEEPIKFIENEQNMTLIFETDHGHYLCFQDREKVTTRWNLNGLKSTKAGLKSQISIVVNRPRKIKQLHHETFIKRKKNLRGKVKYELTFMLHRI